MYGASGSGGGGDDELSLPRATVQKIIAELIPADMSCARETRDLVIECCVEFIHLLSSESNDVCERASKKTIAPEHVVAALKDLGFEAYTAEIAEILEEHKVQLKDRERKTGKMEKSGLSMEELERQQQLLFAASAARYDPSSH
ncbi:histone-fold-containing protein [Ceraceosorus guamensis]|uniref:Histone-fold-containing protein n=1 Tax=Ceraceosorus guamensis TaxID=1522189 RepID=A0A316VNA1_9BASI|nr:histone-fold-containing protein [Ceraceosorus guamensis]PWN38784.1 histone-fold-containing protein [Ceraceosorus guamensis]